MRSPEQYNILVDNQPQPKIINYLSHNDITRLNVVYELAIHKEYLGAVAEKFNLPYNSTKNIWFSFIEQSGRQFALNREVVGQWGDTSNHFIHLWNKCVKNG